MGRRRNSMAAGVAFTLLGGMLWGVSGTSVQYLTTIGGAAPTLVTFLRVLLGGGIFFGILCITNGAVIRAMFRGAKNVGSLLLFAFALYANQLCYAQTVQVTNAGIATVLQMLGSAFVLIHVCVTCKRAPRSWEAIGLVLAVVATLCIATQGDITCINMPWDGLIWGIATGVSTAVYIVVPQRTGLFQRFGSAPVVGVGMFLGAIFALPVYLLQGGGVAEAVATLGAFNAFEWMVFFGGLVVVGTIGGYGLYLHGVSIVGSVRGKPFGGHRAGERYDPSSALAGYCVHGVGYCGYRSHVPHGGFPQSRVNARGDPLCCAISFKTAPDQGQQYRSLSLSHISSTKDI